MEPDLIDSAGEARARICSGSHTASAFLSELLAVPYGDRDAWLDRVLGLQDVADDGPELPRGCVPYLPCSVDAILRVIAHAGISASDVFVDLGSGLGRVIMLVHLLTGASAVGIEIQSTLVARAKDLASRLALPRVQSIQGDVCSLANLMTDGSVFFLYCPFSGERLDKVLDDLAAIASARPIRVCSVDLPLPLRASLKLAFASVDGIAIYRS